MLSNATPAVTNPVPSLHPAVEVGTVTLKVADLPRSIAFYTERIGLVVLSQTDTTAMLGAGNRPILSLIVVTNPTLKPRNTTGLYHAAILFPDRHALAVKITQLAALRLPIGSGDHFVSEAFYLDDPDGNGLELYRDRPRAEWHWTGDSVQMATEPIDFENFFAEVDASDPALADPRAPAGTKLGHVHLKVANIAAAEAFYHGVLGFDVVAHLPSALFVSAGKYHHHLGFNIWELRNGRPAPADTVGLQEYSISLPDQAERDRLLAQIAAAGIAIDRSDADPVIADPFQNRIRLVIG